MFIHSFISDMHGHLERVAPNVNISVRNGRFPATSVALSRALAIGNMEERYKLPSDVRLLQTHFGAPRAQKMRQESYNRQVRGDSSPSLNQFGRKLRPLPSVDHYPEYGQRPELWSSVILAGNDSGVKDQFQQQGYVVMVTAADVTSDDATGSSLHDRRLRCQSDARNKGAERYDAKDAVTTSIHSLSYP